MRSIHSVDVRITLKVSALVLFCCWEPIVDALQGVGGSKQIQMCPGPPSSRFLQNPDTDLAGPIDPPGAW